MLSILKLRFMQIKTDFVIVVIMMAMVIFMTFIFGGAFSDNYSINVWIVDLDNTPSSKQVIENLSKNEVYKVVEATSYDEVKKRIEDNDYRYAVVIEEGFEEKLFKYETDAVTVRILQSEDNMEARNIYTVIEDSINTLSASNNIASSILYLEIGTYDELFDRANTLLNENNYTVSGSLVKDIESKNNTLKHYVIGFMLFFSMFGIVFSAADVLNDRKYNTYGRMLVSPITKTSILGGNLIMGFLIGTFQIVVLMLGVQLIYGIQWGPHLWMILLVGISFVFTVSCMGMMISGLVKTPEQLSAVTPIVLVSTSMLGGCMWPIEILNSKWLINLAEITPQRWALRAMESIAMYDKSLSVGINAILVLIGMGLVYFLIGVYLFGRE